MRNRLQAPGPGPALARGIRWAFRAAALLFLVAVVLLVATAQGRTGFRTALFVAQILPEVPIKPQAWFTSAPTRREVAYPLASGSGVADLYAPAGGGEHGAVLLFLGVNPAGRDDPRVVNLAEGLARAGTVVMIPWSDTMTRRRIAVEEVDNLVRAFQYLRTVEGVDPDRAGMGGFCVGASLAAVAAEDPRIADHVRFVNFFAGYYDAADLVKAIASRSRFYGGLSEPWEPDPLALEVFTTLLLDGVPDARERDLLSAAFANGGAPLAVETGTLSPEAEAVAALLSGTTLEEAGAALDGLPPTLLESIRAISPSTRVADLKARVLIMHDREDRLVPSEESRRLRDALGQGGDVYYTEFSFFQHVDPTESVGPVRFGTEALKLFLHMYQVLRAVG